MMGRDARRFGLGVILVATSLAAGHAQAQATDCGAEAEPPASLQTQLSTEIKLGRKDNGSVATQVSLTWSQDCAMPESVELEIVDGALAGDEASLSTSEITIGRGDVIGETLYVVLTVDRSRVEPGKYSGTLLVRAKDGEVEIATGSIPVVVMKQEAIFGPTYWWNPLLLLGLAAVGGIIFAWFRALALSGDEQMTVRQQRWVAPRNLVAVGLGLGAGITAWNAAYLSKPDFQMDAEAVLALLAVTAAAVVTAVLTFLKPSETTHQATKIEAGTPSTITPNKASPPANVDALIGLGALGNTTPWSAGEFVQLGDGSHAHWTQQGWAVGKVP